VGAEQIFEAQAQLGVTCAGFLEEGSAVRGGLVEGGQEEGLGPLRVNEHGRLLCARSTQ
jgi:hypothetical protein